MEATLTHENALEVLAGCDVVVDASDNPRTRYLVNDACVLSGKPLVSVVTDDSHATCGVLPWLVTRHQADFVGFLCRLLEKCR